MKRPFVIKRFIWTIPLVAIVVLVPTAVVLAATGEGGFDGVVDSIESEYHVHATRIPFMGLVSLVAGAATHDGVRGLHVAEFENFKTDIDGRQLKQMVEKKLGSGWELMVRETSRKGGEQTLIYCRPEGKHMGLFIIDQGHGEMDVVQISVDPEHLSENIGKYDHQHSQGSTGTEED